VRPSNGCVTASDCSPMRPSPKSWHGVSRIPGGCISFPRSSGWDRPIGSRPPAARSLGSPAGRQPLTSCERRSRPWRSAVTIYSRPWWATPR
jgi:hypothetical protein